MRRRPIVGDAAIGKVANLCRLFERFRRAVADLHADMANSRTLPFVLAFGFALAEFAGCSAPQGPIGGMHVAGCLTKCGHRATPVCDENDPQIVPPHSNFHPLPTRPAFSRPEGLENAYSPLPVNDAMQESSSPAQPLEVRDRRSPAADSQFGGVDNESAGNGPAFAVRPNAERQSRLRR
jgi:hypothetical protein